MQPDSTKSREIRKTDFLSEKEKQTRKEQVLAQGRPSITRSIADAIVIKNTNVYFLTDPNGSVPLGDSHGYGLYYHDCRFLNGYQLCLANSKLNPLVSATPSGDSAIFELTNPELLIEEGKHIPSDQIGLTWERTLDGRKNVLNETIRIKNYGREAIHVPLQLTFQAGFEDVFSIRGLLTEQPGKLIPPQWKKEKLIFDYEGADERLRRLSIGFSKVPDEYHETSVEFGLSLDAGEIKEVMVTLAVSEISTAEPRSQHLENSSRSFQGGRAAQQPPTEQIGNRTLIRSDSLLLDQILENSFDDLRTLITRLDGHEFFAAGIPWFGTLFGRDSLITALQTLAIHPEIAERTLRLLAEFQARERDTWRDAQPGKILHELRVGELARLGSIPHTPYYGTVDATPLFLIVLARHAEWTGDLSLFKELRQHVIDALEWIDRYGDANGDGYVEYKSTSAGGLLNQGWKDSGDAIVDSHGNLAKPPISLVEVQGYVYQAKMGLARLFERNNEPERARALREEAGRLRSNFNQEFWMEDQGIYTLALDRDGRALKVVSSNPGHALWAGVADPDKARSTAERLMAKDMFSGWGIRTLSAQEASYNPIGYHLGTVWPHDNALIAVGFRRYGFDDDAQRILRGILDAAMNFKGYRLPELFAGFARKEYSVPVHYPVACHPQAWAAGSIPYMVSSFLGLEPAAFEHELRIRRPILPEFVDRLRIEHLRVGSSKVDLYFERTSADTTTVDVQNLEGKLEVIQS